MIRRLVLAAALLALAVGLTWWGVSLVNRPAPAPVATIEAPPPAPAPTEASPTPAAPTEEPTPPPKPPPRVKREPAPDLAPPPVEIHTELIPADIKIVRVHYPEPFIGPGGGLIFDINGSGFTQAFRDMITAESGHPDVAVRDLTLITPNQIRGSLAVSKDAPSAAVYPRVLIGDKVVFRAPQPFYMIRPGEVLFLGIVSHGRFGRSGRLRTLTNLTPGMLETFRIVPSTPGITISDISPSPPFVVDATVNVGAVQPGSYGLAVEIGGETVFDRPGIINIVGSDSDDVGIVQRVTPTDGFHRPGDVARFELQGSGFRPDGVARLNAFVPGLGAVPSTFSFVAPGRMELSLTVPLSAPTTVYALDVRQGSTTLRRTDPGFFVVPENWIRQLRVEPALTPGATAALALDGRSLNAAFVRSLTVETATDALKIGPFKIETATRAVAPISAAAGLHPGDYWLKLRAGARPITPQFGSIIEVHPR